MWNDDFHHSAAVAITGHNEAYFSDHSGHPQEFISAMKRGFLFQGQWYSWQKQRRGAPALGLHPANFVNYIQNHDQIANSLRGVRLHELTSPGLLRAMTALLLLGPGTPMLFQGQEFAASAPFLYFADHNPDLAKLVAKGRREFLEQFPSIAHPESTPCLANPESEATFTKCKLDFSERKRNANHYALHHDLLKLRREDPVFHHPGIDGVDGAVLGTEAFVLRFFGGDEGDRLLFINLGADFQLAGLPEPLLAPVAGSSWKLIWSSEDPKYGGFGTPAIRDEHWPVPGPGAVVLASDKSKTNRKESLMEKLIRRISLRDAAGEEARNRLSEEWLVTNGLGGYASGTISGAVSWRYHGLLIAALPSPFGRVVMLNHLAESLRLSDGRLVQFCGHESQPHDGILSPAASFLVQFRLEIKCPFGGLAGKYCPRKNPRSALRTKHRSRHLSPSLRPRIAPNAELAPVHALSPGMNIPSAKP